MLTHVFIVQINKILIYPQVTNNNKIRHSKVELEGFEPSSKQGTDKLSTRLFCCWFSSIKRKQTP